MADLSHRNVADMNVLRSMVLLVPLDAQVRFAANICGQRLMLGPLWLRAMHWTICKVRGWNATVTWFLFFERLQRGFPEQVVDDFANHIRHGKDASDRSSVGGVNQQEVETTLALLRHFLRDADIPVVYRSILWPEECSGRDDPEERCPRHPRDCVCWKSPSPQPREAG